MATIKALKVEKLVFVLPDTFCGDEADALSLAAEYMKKRRGDRNLRGPTDPRVSTRKATVDILDGGARLSAIMRVAKLDVPDQLLKRRPAEHQGIVVPSIVVPGS